MNWTTLTFLPILLVKHMNCSWLCLYSRYAGECQLKQGKVCEASGASEEALSVKSAPSFAWLSLCSQTYFALIFSLSTSTLCPAPFPLVSLPMQCFGFNQVTRSVPGFWHFCKVCRVPAGFWGWSTQADCVHAPDPAGLGLVGGREGTIHL